MDPDCIRDSLEMLNPDPYPDPQLYFKENPQNDQLISYAALGVSVVVKRRFFKKYFNSTLRYLPPLRFHCDGGCWD
jgi:hypothetical protein